MSNKSIFRSASLERLNTPEQLDVMVEVTQPRGWLVLAMIGIVLAVVIIWSFIGSIPTRVSGPGMLVRGGSMAQVVSMTTGQIQEVIPGVGESIKQGQVVARIYSPDLVSRLQNMRTDLDEKQDRYRQVADYHDQRISHLKDNLNRIKKVNIRQQLNNLEDRRQFLTRELQKQQSILQRGLITPKEINNTQVQLNGVVDQINSLKLTLNEDENTLFNTQKEAERELLRSRNEIDEYNREIRRQESQLNLQSLIKSPISGRVVEVRAKVGSFIKNGDPILILEDPRQKMEALIYINASDGKRVSEGMEIDISPSTVKREEFGSILGLVTGVSKFPASPDMIGQAIPNKAIAEALLAEGAPIEIHADLIPDPHTFSGFKWTSSDGPRTEIQVGTMVVGSVRVRERRPITLVLPFFKKLFGVQ